MKILVIGERMNRLSSWSPTDAVRDSDRYWQIMRRLGAFRDDRSRRQLRSVGVDLTDDGVSAINLLTPAPQTAAWDVMTARQVAVEWLPRIAAEFDLVMLCGRRVVDAFNVELLGTMAECHGSVVDLELVDAVVLPHPSGLNRWWNDEAAVTELRERMEACLSA
jgi:uracil-DNA glycosylase